MISAWNRELAWRGGRVGLVRGLLVDSLSVGFSPVVAAEAAAHARSHSFVLLAQPGELFLCRGQLPPLSGDLPLPAKNVAQSGHRAHLGLQDMHSMRMDILTSWDSKLAGHVGLFGEGRGTRAGLALRNR